MPIRSIIVHLDLEEPAQQRIAFAADLAGRLGAHLIGFAAGNVLPMVWATDGAVVDATIYQEQISYIENRTKVLRTEFEETMAGADASFRSFVDDPVHALARCCRAADLIIAGNTKTPSASNSLDIGDMILSAGRAVMLPASDYAPLRLERILIAWKDAREARRAISDAMPFLSESEEVIIATICEANDPDSERESLADVARFLERHVARVSTELVDTGSGMRGDTIAEIAKERGANLVVAGAYGHSRLREWIFGGVTRDLLNEGTVTRLFAY